MSRERDRGFNIEGEEVTDIGRFDVGSEVASSSTVASSSAGTWSSVWATSSRVVRRCEPGHHFNLGRDLVTGVGDFKLDGETA